MKTTSPAPLISLGALAIATALGTGGCDEAPEQKNWTESLPPESSGPPEFCADKDIATATNDTGDPIGGGTGYSRGPASCDVEVDTAAALVDALEGAVAGQIVCVADGAEIDLTGQRDIPLTSGVTLAGHRGHAGSEGGLLFTDELDVIPALFVTAGDQVRLTGLRLRGPDTQIRTDAYEVPNSRAIQSSHRDLQVDNCELWGWSHGAVVLLEGADAQVHHNYIHHCRRTGLGYGVALDRASALIEANLFDWNRHSIAGTGWAGTSYEARFNYVLDNANSHAFDMHGGADRDDGTDIAGTTIRIHHNTFRLPSQPAVKIRGIPVDGAWLDHNWLVWSPERDALLQTHGMGHWVEADNCWALYPFPEHPNVPKPAAGELWGEWSFDEGQGSVVGDSSPQGNDGVLVDLDPATSWIEGTSGTALAFPGTSGHLDLGAGPSLGTLDPLAIDLQLRFDRFGEQETVLDDGVVRIFHRGGFAGDRLYFLFAIEEQVEGGESSWTGTTGIRTVTELVAGQWYHVVAIRIGDQLRLYVDGIEQQQADCLADYTVLHSAIDNLRVGSELAGAVDQLRIYPPEDVPDANHPPALSWAGESGYEDDGVAPDTGDGATTFRFRVRYTDADGHPPETGYPRLHLARNGTEDDDLGPLSMMAADDAPFTSGRTYVYSTRLPPGATYAYSFAANDAEGLAGQGTPTTLLAGPTLP